MNHGLGHPARELQKPDRAQLPRRESGAVDPRGQGHVDRRAGSVAAGSRVQGADEDGIAGFQRRDLRVVLRMRRGRVGAVSSVVGTSGEAGTLACSGAPRRTSLARPAGSIPAAFAASALSSPTKHLSGTSRIADHPIRSDRSVTLIAGGRARALWQPRTTTGRFSGCLWISDQGKGQSDRRARGTP